MAGPAARTLAMVSEDMVETVTDISKYHSIGEFYDMFKEGTPACAVHVSGHLTSVRSRGGVRER